MGIQSTNNTATLNIYTAKEFNGIAGFSKHNFDTIFEPLQRLFGLNENKPSEKIEGYVMDHDPSLTRNLTENDQVMDGSRNLLLGNQSLLLNNQGLLPANTGFFLNIAFMLMVINSKTDRNYEAILKMETKVDKNYETIRRVKNKVDRNLEVMLSKFKISERNLSNTMEKAFTDIVDFVRQTRIEGVTSELITFMKYFIQERDTIRYLTHDQYVTKLDEVNDILCHLQNSRVPQPGSLHTLLHNIISQRFAIPENSHDKVAFTALGLLCSGTAIYISAMHFSLEEYSYLANFHYQHNDLEKYNYYLFLISTTFNDFKNLLASSNGLINKVIDVLNEVKLYDFIQDEREDIVKFTSERIDSLNLIKSKFATINNNLSQEIPTEKIKYNFFDSHVDTPVGKWENRRKVSYAIQFHSYNTYYPVGEWSIPYAIREKANPSLHIGADPQGRTRLIFRKFDNDKPELVGIIEDSTQRDFVDISRGLYNAVLEPNEEVSIDEMEIFLGNGANVDARYEGERQVIHAAVIIGNHYIVATLKSKGADINARDINGYTSLHIAAEVGHGSFIKYLVGNGANVNAKTNFGDTALHIAAEKGHIDAVINLMQIEGININEKDPRGFTALHTAASFGSSSIINILSQDDRTDINAQSDVGLTPLHLAVIGGHNDAVEILLASDGINLNAKTKSGLTVLHFVSLLGNPTIAKSIIKYDGININEKSLDGWVPLHSAIESKKEDAALELLSTNSIKVNIKGKDDITPLHLAALNGQDSIVSKLLDKGASIENVDKHGYTPLHFAIESGDLEIVKRLVAKGADLYAKRKDGYSPLDLAVFYGKLDIVQFFVNNKRVNINTKNKNGMTPIDFAAHKGYFGIIEFLIDKGAEQGFALHWATYGGHFNIAKYLVNERHFDLNKKDKYGNVPLHIAALRGHLNILRYFVNHTQVNLDIENNNGHTPFLLAVLSSNLDMVKYFIEKKGINFTNQSDNNGNTALHLAVLGSNLDIVKYFIEEEHVNADFKGTDGGYHWTPLYFAACNNKLDVVKYLIDRGANLHVIDKYGYTPFHRAVEESALNVVKYFIEEKRLDVNLEGADGGYHWTPLHWAAYDGKLDLVKYLIDKGASSYALDIYDHTPLHKAAQQGSLSVVKYFIEEKGMSVNEHYYWQDTDCPISCDEKWGPTPLKLLLLPTNMSGHENKVLQH